MVKSLVFKIGLVIGCVVLMGCGKKKNEKLAQNYYKLSVAQLSHAVNSSGEELLACKQALDYIDKALEQQPTAEYLAFKATLLLKLQHFDDSQKFFKLALKEKIAPALKGEIMNNYACLLAQHNQESQALDIWRNLVSDEYYLTPEVAYVNQGKVFAAKDKYKEAKKCFSKAVELAPDYVDAHYYLAVLAKQHGDMSLAKNSMSAALYLEPMNKGIQLAAQTFGIDISLESLGIGSGESEGKTA